MSKEINVQLHDKPDFYCPRCGCDIFTQASRLKILPAFTAGNSNPIAVGIQVLCCAACHYVHDQRDIENALRPSIFTGSPFPGSHGDI